MFFQHSSTNPPHCIGLFCTVFYSPTICHACLKQNPHIFWETVLQLTCLTLKVKVICCQIKEHHHHLHKKNNSIANSFIFSVTLLNHLFIENHIPFIHIDANPAKFNAQCLLPWIWDTEKNTESVAEKQQRSFHCQTARVSGTDYCLSMKHSQKSN